jgi:hypothetical protein
MELKEAQRNAAKSNNLQQSANAAQSLHNRIAIAFSSQQNHLVIASQQPRTALTWKCRETKEERTWSRLLAMPRVENMKSPVKMNNVVTTCLKIAGRVLRTGVIKKQTPASVPMARPLKVCKR